MPYNTTNNVLSLHVLVQIVCYSNVDIQFSITGLFLLFFCYTHRRCVSENIEQQLLLHLFLEWNLSYCFETS